MADRLIGVTDTAPGAGVADYRVRERTVNGNTADEQYLIEVSERVRSGGYHVNTGRHNVTAAAQGATAAHWFLVNPTASGVLMAVRAININTGILATGTAFANGPRFTVERFSYTGAPLGATINPGKRRSTDSAAVGVLYTANTGMVITSGETLFAAFPVAAASNTTNPGGGPRPWMGPRKKFPSWGDAETVNLAAGEGLLFRQADVGTGTESALRAMSSSISWEEYTLP